ncbi:TIGR00282 family metallophosphoesterase [Thalassospira lucentensis]|uniref:TIGR00282 family metallophosphoesterase n=1 Tax=Thalassospira lucentensis TaxID=168935 RepID=UPI00142E0320|nr:TIGR00282 family metallophosphoesterase [Thalassospira lucentensis]NIZ03629.1 TIGR00282 family metallophosphoesterase [Thalassospira lucentensis]
MRLLHLGDVLGQTGRTAALEALPMLRDRLSVDVAVVNVENSAHGFGVTAKICKEFYDAGADVLTTGNHVWDQREIIAYIDEDEKLLRPWNFPDGTPGKGDYVFKTKAGKKVCVINMMGRLFMDPLSCPFQGANKLFSKHKLGKNVDAIIIDFHAETTSEKMAFGHHCDGRASLVLGTHTHVPTADAQILPNGTGYQTDVGMCGDFDSVIGMKKENSVRKFLTKMPSGRFEPADGPATVCGVFIETDDKTGLAKRIESVRIGGRLKGSWPSA